MKQTNIPSIPTIVLSLMLLGNQACNQIQNTSDSLHKTFGYAKVPFNQENEKNDSTFIADPNIISIRDIPSPKGENDNYVNVYQERTFKNGGKDTTSRPNEGARAVFDAHFSR